MPKSKNQKQKILNIMKFFYEETDEEHTLTVNEIIAKLERNGISAARRSIYDDIVIVLVRIDKGGKLAALYKSLIVYDDDRICNGKITLVVPVFF